MVVGGLAQGFSLNRPHPMGATQDTNFTKGFAKGIVPQIFGEDFGGSGRTATTLSVQILAKILIITCNLQKRIDKEIKDVCPQLYYLRCFVYGKCS